MLREFLALNRGKLIEHRQRELFERGYSIDQVEHARGDGCQAATELATGVDSVIITSEFQLLNHGLDNAIAAAVIEFDKRRHQLVSKSSHQVMNARLQGFRAGSAS